MQITCGTDIIEIERIKESIENLKDAFTTKIYTPKEIEYCESKKNAKYEHYAARFAAKEAIYKAISPILNNKYEISWKDAEVVNDINGKPYVNFINYKTDKIESIDISLSHCKKYATANVTILLKNNLEEK